MSGCSPHHAPQSRRVSRAFSMRERFNVVARVYANCPTSYNRFEYYANCCHLSAAVLVWHHLSAIQCSEPCRQRAIGSIPTRNVGMHKSPASGQIDTIRLHVYRTVCCAFFAYFRRSKHIPSVCVCVCVCPILTRFALSIVCAGGKSSRRMNGNL